HTVGRLMDPELMEPDGTFKIAKLAQMLAAEKPLTAPGSEQIRGRTVFVGASAAGTYDQKLLPIGGVEPGVLIHWTAWSNLAGGGFIRAVPGWVAPVLALLLVAVLALTGVRQ